MIEYCEVYYIRDCYKHTLIRCGDHVQEIKEKYLTRSELDLFKYCFGQDCKHVDLKKSRPDYHEYWIKEIMSTYEEPTVPLASLIRNI